MKKQFLKNNGKEVKFGDIIYARNVTGYPSIMLVTVDEDSVDTLRELGIVIEKDVEDGRFDIDFINCYLNAVYEWIANKLDISIQGAKN